MSRLLSKLSPLVHKTSCVRLFSSSTTGPSVSICSMMTPSPDGRSNVGEVLLYDVQKKELVRSPEKNYPKELSESQLVGASHGWGFFSNRQDDGSVVVTDFLNPYASKTNPKLITLPPFTTLPFCQTQVICNVAMSSSPDPYDENWCVGIKFLGQQLSLCMPHRDQRWTNIRVPFESWDFSKLMFSKKDQKFYMLAPGGNYLCSWDLNFKENNKPEFHELVLPTFLNIPRSQRELVDGLCREDHWVESPSGESFLVKCFTQYTPPEGLPTQAGFSKLVFREEETNVGGIKLMSDVEDIGDLCIFISKSEDFCVEASLCQGLEANSIYMNGRLFAKKKVNEKGAYPELFKYPEGTPARVPYSPYWLPPFSS